MSSVNDCGRRWTISAPTVMPNSATEMATKAKWYHIATLKIRVSTISYISVVSVIDEQRRVRRPHAHAGQTPPWSPCPSPVRRLGVVV